MLVKFQTLLAHLSNPFVSRVRTVGHSARFDEDLTREEEVFLRGNRQLFLYQRLCVVGNYATRTVVTSELATARRGNLLRSSYAGRRT